MPENVRKFVDFCLDDLNSPCSLHIESNGIQWECFVEDLKDWMENLDRKMLFDVEKVDAEEVNFGFTFRAVSREVLCGRVNRAIVTSSRMVKKWDDFWMLQGVL